MLYFANSKRAGILPWFFSEDDPRPARDQLHEGYAHGGGVQPFKGFTLIGDMEKPFTCALLFPEDPPVKAVSWAKLRDEYIILFEYSWVAIVQPDGSYLVTRCD